MKLSLNNLKPYQMFKPKKEKYTRLLLTLISIFIVAPFVETRVGNLFLALGLLWVNLLTLEAIYLAKSIMWILRFVATLGFICDVIYFPNNIHLSHLLSVIAYCCYAFFILAAILIIGSRIFSEPKVTNDILRGGICIYLLLGILWFVLYVIMEFTLNNAFNNLHTNDIATKHKLMYFSFTTLTTLGYGDVTPAAKITMTLSNIQAIIGQLYPSIFLARLVSLYTTDKSHEK